MGFKKGDPNIYDPKVSGPTRGALRKGYDKRRDKNQTSLVKMMQGRTASALETIDYILNAPFRDKRVPITLKFKCAQLVLERGHGKTQDASVLALNEISHDQIEAMSLPDLLAYMSNNVVNKDDVSVEAMQKHSAAEQTSMEQESVIQDKDIKDSVSMDSEE